MKRNIIITLFLAIATAVMAQPKEGTFSIIPRVGVAITSITKDEIYTTSGNTMIPMEKQWKTGMMAGVDFDYQVLPKVSVSLGAYYSEQGCKYKNNNAEDVQTPGSYTGVSNCQTNLKYINVPIMLNMYAAQNFAIKVGLQMGFNVSGKQETTENSFKVTDEGKTEYGKPTTYKADYNAKTFDLAIPIGLSYEYMNVIIDARYNLGLTRICSNLGSYSPKNNAICISAAYRFTL